MSLPDRQGAATAGQVDPARIRVAVVTSFFPHSADRQRAVFVEHLVRAMRRRCHCDVISPMPLSPPLRAFPEWYQLSQVPRRELIDGIEVDHPRYLAVPRLDVASGLTYAASVLPALRRLRAQPGELILHAHCAYPDGVGVALAARRLGLRYAITAHGSDINVYATRRTLRWQIRWALRGAAMTIAVSRDLRGKIERLVAPAPAGGLVHVPCAGFDPLTFRPRDRPTLRRELGVSPEGRLVVFVGQLVAVKRIDVLIEAWRRLHAEGRLTGHDRLVLIGDGRLRADLTRQVDAAGVAEGVAFLGSLAHATVARWIGAADLLCLPSENEGTPNVIVEALASGVPVVASRVGGVPELVTHEHNGLLVPPGDAAACARALEAALGRRWDPEVIRQTVAQATWDAIAGRTIASLGAALGEPHASLG